MWYIFDISIDSSLISIFLKKPVFFELERSHFSRVFEKLYRIAGQLVDEWERTISVGLGRDQAGYVWAG